MLEDSWDMRTTVLLSVLHELLWRREQRLLEICQQI